MTIGGKNVMLDCGMHMGFNDSVSFLICEWYFANDNIFLKRVSNAKKLFNWYEIQEYSQKFYDFLWLSIYKNAEEEM